MNRLMLLAVFSFGFCTMLAAQQAAPVGSTSAVAAQPAVDAQPSVVAEHNEAIKSARTIGIDSKTVFLKAATLERALMMQKNWDRLNLSIVGGSGSTDLKIEVDRLPFTHIRTYVITDTRTNIVLVAGRVRDIDGVVASGPMAEQIVKILSAARLPTRAVGGE
jgi:hypothetical protein